MTNEQAIKYWEEFLNEIPDLLKKGFSKEEAEKQEAACKLAIEALQERPKGRWIEQVEIVCDVPNEEYREEIYYDCSECDCSLHWKAPFCPECGHPMEADGADMRESEQE